MNVGSTRLRRVRRIFLLTVFLAPNLPALAQDGELDKSPLKGLTPQDIIQRFSANEKEWKRVREQYTFRQSVKVQALNGKDVAGDYRQVADISYSQGTRAKKVILSPQPGIEMTKEDLDDVESRSSFTISTDELPLYDVTYEGQQKVDELHCYVFAVVPKSLEKGQRYFQGVPYV